MSVKRRLIKDTILYGAGDVLTKAIAFVLIPLYTRTLIPEQYGVFQLVVLYTTVLMVFSMTGTNMALFRYYVMETKEEKRKQYFTGALIWVIFSAAVLVELTYILQNPLAELFTGSSSQSQLVCLAAINAGLETIILITLLVFRMNKKPVNYVICNLTKVILIVLGNYALVWKMNLGVSGILLAGIAADVLILGPLLWSVGAYITWPVPGNIITTMLLWGFPVMASSMASLVLTLADRMLLRLMAGFSEAGIYSVGYKIAGAVMLMYTAFRFAWGTYMFELSVDNKTAARTYPKVLLVLIAGLGFATIGLVTFSPEIFQIFVGKDFLSSRPVLIPVTAAVVFEAMALIFGAGMETRDRTIYIPAITSVAAIVNILLNIILIPEYGFMGAGWATLASYVMVAYLNYRIGNTFMPVKYPWPRLTAILGAIFIGMGAGWFLKPLFSRIVLQLAMTAVLLYLADAKSLKGIMKKNEG